MKKVKTIINQLFWKFSIPKKTKSQVVTQVANKPFCHLFPNFDDSRINSAFRRDNLFYVHTEHVIIYHDAFIIEPSLSYAIFRFNKINRQSAFYKTLKPSLHKYIKFRAGSRQYKRLNLEKAIIFDGTVGSNYFHFFSDILSKLWLIEKYELSADIPLIIGRAVFETRYFQYLYKNTMAGKFNWVVQEKNEFIRVSKLIVMKPMPYDFALLKKTIQLVDPVRNQNIPSRRIFLSRSKTAGRSLSNHEEIYALLNHFKFEILDSENMDFTNQIKVFSETKFLISIHGAGEANIIFSHPNYLHFTEINPENRIACQYYWLAQSLNIRFYDCILGGPVENLGTLPEGQFWLNPVKLENSISKMLALE